MKIAPNNSDPDAWVAFAMASTVDEIAQNVRSRASLVTPRSLERWLRIAQDARAGKEQERVAVAKLLAALVPESTSAIEGILRSQEPGAGEMRFSLFCFLDHVPAFASEVERTNIENLVRAYLLNVSTEAFDAAWMAGDLLGDHWPTDTSVPILLEVLADARFAAGRKAALHGLAKVLSRVGDATTDFILQRIRATAIKDRSRAVRTHAQDLMRERGQPLASSRR